MRKLLVFILLAVTGGAVYLYYLAEGYRETTFCVIVTSDMGRRPDLMPRAAAAVAEASRSCGGPVVTVDNGGLFSFAAAEAILRSEGKTAFPEARFLAAGGHRFLNVTPDLFRLGAQMLRRFLAEAGVAVVTENLRGGGGKQVVLEDVSVTLYGIAVPGSSRFMPGSLFDGMIYSDPFEGGAVRQNAVPSDINIMVINAGPDEATGTPAVEPAEVLLALNNHFPHLALVVSDQAFPAALVAEAGGKTAFVHLDPARPEFLFAKVHMIRHRDDVRAVITSLDTGRIPFDGASPDPALRDLFASSREDVRRRSSVVIGTPWYAIDLQETRSGDTPAGRLLHETLMAIAGTAGIRAEATLAFVPRRPFRREPGADFSLSDMDALVPHDRYPVVAALTGERLIDLLQRAWERYPDAATSLFPFAYTVQKGGTVHMEDLRFSPARSYTVVMDGPIADLLAPSGDEGGTVTTSVLPERPAERLARRFPAKLSYQFSPLWKSE